MWVYIDESGDLGKKGRYFLLAAAVCRDDAMKKMIKNAVRTAKVSISNGGKLVEELHAVNMSYATRQYFLNKLVNIDGLRYEILIIDKKLISFELNRQTRNIAYNYFSGILVEQIVKK